MERMTKDEFKKARRTLGITGEELADRLDVRPDTLRKWESGKQPIPYAVASELSEIAGDRIRELMEAAAVLADLRAAKQRSFKMETKELSIRTIMAGVAEVWLDGEHIADVERVSKPVQNYTDARSALPGRDSLTLTITERKVWRICNPQVPQTIQDPIRFLGGEYPTRREAAEAAAQMKREGTLAEMI